MPETKPFIQGQYTWRVQVLRIGGLVDMTSPWEELLVEEYQP